MRGSNGSAETACEAGAAPGYETEIGGEKSDCATPLCAAVPLHGLGYTGSGVVFFILFLKRGRGGGLPGGMTTTIDF